MCGEFGWDDDTWNWAIDRTTNFLNKPGLKWFEDSEDYYSDKNHCKALNPKDRKPPLDLQHYTRPKW